MSDSNSTVQFWLDSAGRVPLLSKDQEITLGRHVQQWQRWPDGPDAAPPLVQRRGRRARDRMLTANLRLVVAVAKRYGRVLQAHGMGLEDGLQLGAIGLVRGVELFDPTRGYKFSTYAYWWIKQSISRAIETSDAIRVPLHLQQLQRRLKPGELEQLPPELRERLAAAIAAQRISSLDARTKDEGAPLLELMVDERQIEQQQAADDAERDAAVLIACQSAVTPEQWQMLLRCGHHKRRSPGLRQALEQVRAAAVAVIEVA